MCKERRTTRRKSPKNGVVAVSLQYLIINVRKERRKIKAANPKPSFFLVFPPQTTIPPHHITIPPPYNFVIPPKKLFSPLSSSQFSTSGKMTERRRNQLAVGHEKAEKEAGASVQKYPNVPLLLSFSPPPPPFCQGRPNLILLPSQTNLKSINSYPFSLRRPPGRQARFGEEEGSHKATKERKNHEREEEQRRPTDPTQEAKTYPLYGKERKKVS